MSVIVERIRAVTAGTLYEGRLWLVGGYIRDRLLGVKGSLDVDLVIEGDATELASFLFSKGLGTSKPRSYERFGTAMLAVEGIQVELATARKESYSKDSRKPSVEPATLREDAFRRDFTVNALFENLHTGECLDPTGLGFSDLRSGILRTPLPAEATFAEDPLRMLRAVRLKNALSFHYGPGMEDAIRASAGRLKIVSYERIRDEWIKMLTMRAASECMKDLQRLQILGQFAPEVVPDSQTSSKFMVAMLDRLAPACLEVALTSLFLGRASGRASNLDREGIHTALQRLRFPKSSIAKVLLLVDLTIRAIEDRRLSLANARRILMLARTHTDSLIQLLDAIAHSSLAKSLQNRSSTAKNQLIAVRSECPPETIKCPLSGNEIMQVLGVNTGIIVGQASRDLLDLVLKGKLAPGDKVGATVWLRANSRRYE